MTHHLHVHLHLKTKVITMVRIPRVSELNLSILKTVWHKGVVSLLHVLSVIGTTQVFVVRALLVVSSVIRIVIF